MVEPIQEPLRNEPHRKLPPKLTPEELKKESQAKVSAREAFEHKSIDPAGIWAKFLSMHGTQDVTEDDVKMVIQGLEKVLQFVVQINAKAAKRASDKLKESQE